MSGVQVFIPPQPKLPNVDTAAGRRAIAVAVENLGRLAYNYWRTLAAHALDNSFELYWSAVQPWEKFPGTPNQLEVVRIVFDPGKCKDSRKKGFVSNLEFGGGAHTARDILRRSLKTKTAADGHSYLIIPFESSHYSKRTPGFRLKTGGRLPKMQMPPTVQEKTGVNRRSRQLSYEALSAKIGIATPMKIERGRQAFFTEYRTIDNSTNWKHPGFAGLNLREEVVDQIDNVIAPYVMGDAISMLIMST